MTDRSPLRIHRGGLTDRPAADTAVSRAVLLRVASGDEPETFRLSRTGLLVAFGKQDTNRAGFRDAVLAARANGYEALVRLAGGRPVVFHDGTLTFAYAVREETPVDGIKDRFVLVADVMVGALARLGVDARVGEIPGEYCPGEYSVNARGAKKLVGIGQRLIRGAAHVGGVIVVDGADRVRDALLPVYEALGIDWDPGTVGSVADEMPGATLGAVADAVVAVLGERFDVSEGEPSPGTYALAETLEPEHLAPAFGPEDEGLGEAAAG
ncbi:MAG: lipoate--protein ligase family protein [Nitriliruptorales bacterium]